MAEQFDVLRAVTPEASAWWESSVDAEMFGAVAELVARE
jgi:hypothetical protein